MADFINSNPDFFNELQALLVAADSNMRAVAQAAVSARLDIDAYQVKHHAKNRKWQGISECYYKVQRTKTDKWLRVLLDAISNVNDCINSSETIYDGTGHKAGIKYAFMGLSEDTKLCLMLLEQVVAAGDRAYEVATKSEIYTKVKARSVWRADFANAFLEHYKVLVAEQVETSRESHKAVFYDKCKSVDTLMLTS